jgi:isoquinoline 1-oxidoreductase subunit beta
MTRTFSPRRRDFIRVVSTAGAGLLLDIRLTLHAQVQDGGSPFAPNAWLRIDRDGTITIVVARSEMGQGVRTSLPMILAEELDADWASVRVEQALADEKYGSQGTGGSTSVRTSWEKLRKAGATARTMLISAAAKQWNVAESECRTAAGKVVHAPTGRILSYGELAPRAAGLPVPDKVTLKDPSQFRIIGTRMPRTDTPSKVDGSALFGIDIRLPGMLYATVARCPAFGGSARSWNDAGARRVPGFRSVIRISSGIAVVADTTWAAFRSRDALVIDWDMGPHAKLSSEGIRKQFLDAASKPGAVGRSEGDVDTALAGAFRRVDAVYEVPFLAHATMEPMNCVAVVTEKHCEIWVSTQDPQGFQAAAMKITGFTSADVVVHTTLLGGGFGRRFEPDVLADAVETSKVLRAPVKVTWTREDDMQHDWYRPASYHLLTGGLDKQGRLIALRHRIVAPSIDEQGEPGVIKDGLDKSAIKGAADLLYTIPNFRVEYIMSNTPVPIGSWRSVYPSQNVFATESFIDELAHAAGKDPLAFRESLVTDAPRLKAVLRLAAERSGWGSPLPAGHARGIAISPPSFFRTPTVQVVEVSVTAKKEIRLHRVTAAIDCGIAINPDGIEAQMEGGFVYGATAALKGDVTIRDGRVVQENFNDYPIMTIDEMPVVDTVIARSTEPPSGTGEPGLPPAAPAIGNAAFALTGQRLRTLPFRLSRT